MPDRRPEHSTPGQVGTPCAIFFDLDGTLTNPKTGITRCIQYALERLEQDAPCADELEWCIGPPLHASFAKLVGQARSERAVALYRERFADVGWSENERYDGVTESLQALQALGHPLYVATSKPHVFARRIVDYFELSPFFDHLFGSELDGTNADKATLLRHALTATAAGPGSTMIGDRHHDIDGARANGMRAIGVSYGYGSKAELVKAGAHQIVEAPDQIPDLFRA